MDLAASDESQTPTDFEVVYWGLHRPHAGAMTGGVRRRWSRPARSTRTPWFFTTGASATFEPAYGLGHEHRVQPGG